MASSEALPSGSALGSRGMTKNVLLLVIDDEPNVRYSLENALRSDTLDVLTVPTAKQGIRLAREKSPDAVLLDVRLPDMSGLDAFVQFNRPIHNCPSS